MTQRVLETMLEPPLLNWLRQRRWLSSEGKLIHELPWFGRRVDIAILGKSGGITAFELKVANNGRAIAQAVSNALAFDRSYIVTGAVPGPDLLREAREAGVGVIHIHDEAVTLLLRSVRTFPPDPLVRRRLKQAVMRRP